ncbi:MAG: hypothetical protein M5U01_17760 [Ardenticatenaceae bacterium]|nr:hypothetical protein [Ardenticatenaceae bacterium]
MRRGLRWRRTRRGRRSRHPGRPRGRATRRHLCRHRLDRARGDSAPTATLPAAPVVAGLELSLTVAPEAVGPGEPVTLTVGLTNPPAGQAYERLVLVSELPPEALPVPNRGDAEIVPGPHPALRWELSGLAVGTTWQGRAQVRLTGGVIDRDVPLAVDVRAATPTMRAWAEAVVGVRHPRAAATIGPDGGRLESADGRLRIEVPAGAVSEPVDLRYTPSAIRPTTRSFTPSTSALPPRMAPP